MFAMPTMSYGQSVPPVMAAMSQGVASNTTIGNIPTRTVYSAIALPNLQNQRGGGAAYTAQPSISAPTLASPMVAAQSLASLTSAGGSADFSVAFFAQLLGQSSAAVQSQLTISFPNPVPLRAGDPAIFDVYSNIKYMPSATSAPTPAAMPTTAPPLPVPQQVAVAEPQRAAPAEIVMQTAVVMNKKSPEEAYRLAVERKVAAIDVETNVA